MIIQNLGNNDVAIGDDNTVTFATGVIIPKGSSMEFPFGVNANVWAICDTGKTANLRVLEAAS